MRSSSEAHSLFARRILLLYSSNAGYIVGSCEYVTAGGKMCNAGSVTKRLLLAIVWYSTVPWIVLLLAMEGPRPIVILPMLPDLGGYKVFILRSCHCCFHKSHCAYRAYFCVVFFKRSFFLSNQAWRWRLIETMKTNSIWAYYTAWSQYL